MKEYVKPQLDIKSMLQSTPISAEDDDSGSVFMSVPQSWWPF